jgi:hypothetical protein
MQRLPTISETFLMACAANFGVATKTAQFETDKVSAKPLSVRAIEGTVEKQAEPKLGLAWVDTNFANHSRREQRISNVAH